MYKVLVADDEAEVIELVRLYLEKDGFEVLTADDGMTALGIVETEKLDCAILDVMMPELNGFQLLKKIREKSNIPVIMLTARASFQQDYRACGASGIRCNGRHVRKLQKAVHQPVHDSVHVYRRALDLLFERSDCFDYDYGRSCHAGRHRSKQRNCSCGLHGPARFTRTWRK